MVRRRTLLFLVEVKGHGGSRGSNSENLVNTISQFRKLRLSSYVMCKCIMVRRTLSFLVEVKGHLGSPGVTRGHQGSKPENLVNTIFQVRKLGSSSYLVCRCVMVRRRTTLFFDGGQTKCRVTRGQTLKTSLVRYHTISRYPLNF